MGTGSRALHLSRVPPGLVSSVPPLTSLPLCGAAVAGAHISPTSVMGFIHLPCSLLDGGSHSVGLLFGFVSLVTLPLLPVLFSILASFIGLFSLLQGATVTSLCSLCTSGMSHALRFCCSLEHCSSSSWSSSVDTTAAPPLLMLGSPVLCVACPHCFGAGCGSQRWTRAAVDLADRPHLLCGDCC